MQRKPRVVTPAYCLHKSTGQGFVKLNGKPHYLGVHDKPETKQKYFRLLSEWELNGRQPIAPKEDMRVIDLIERYWQFAKSAYRKPDGILLLVHGSEPG